VRLAVYSDFAYRRHGGAVYAEQAFVIFLVGLRDYVDRLVLLGRLDPAPRPWHFELPDTVDYEALPHYSSLSEPWSVLSAIGGSVKRFWRVLGEVDVVWLFGPNPLAVLFALLGAMRRRTVVLGVRQDYVAYVGNRHPGRPLMRLAASVLDAAFRLLARRCAVLVVGPRLAHGYSRARRLGVMTVSLTSERELAAVPEPASGVTATGDTAVGAQREAVTVLSVGRLDNEKNPLLLADTLALLNRENPAFTLRVCGEGPLEPGLRERLDALGMSAYAELLGFVPAGPRLQQVYRDSDIFFHTSLTEGVPQVLFEAFAAALPVVATDVGAVAETVDGAALLVPPSDPEAAAAALRRLAGDPALRHRLSLAGHRIARENTREARCGEVAAFLEERAAPRAGGAVTAPHEGAPHAGAPHAGAPHKGVPPGQGSASG
jgi:glycosyltransferase involved in cell wall biosynthesis